MSLEETLKRNNELLEKNNDLIAQLIGAAGKGPAQQTGGSSTSTDEDTGGEEGDDLEELRAQYEKKFGKRPGRMKRENIVAALNEAEGGSSDTDLGDDGVAFADLKKELASWLGEFAKEEDKANPDGTHPEVIERREALRTVLNSDKIGVKKLDELNTDDKAEERAKILNWLNNKAKTVDRGHGIGRFVADPAGGGSDDDDDGLGV